MPVDSEHPEYTEYLGRWNIVKDVVRSNVKQKKYIKDVEDEDSITVNTAASDVNIADQGRRSYYNGQRIKDAACSRNIRYRDDAIFTNFTGKTRSSLIGAVFKKDIVAELPTAIDYLIKDATGTSVTLNRLAQQIVGKILDSGRYGLLVDYPASEEGLSQQEIDELNLKARIYCYDAQSIINWAVENQNGLPVVTLIVLKEECVELSDDGFAWVKKTSYRVLRLIDGIYVQQVYDEKLEFDKEYIPRDFDGNPFDVIPFIFIGSENNDCKVDSVPLYDLAMQNIGHLRNSADYEEAVFICGQPTLMISTETPFEVFHEWNPDGVKIGSRRGYNLGVNAKAWFLQPNSNIAALDAMKLKEDQMQKTSARFTSAGGTNETAEGVRMRLSADTAELTIYALNTQEGIFDACVYAARFMMGAAYVSVIDKIKISVNTDFIEKNIDAPMITQLVLLMNNRVIAMNDVRNTLRQVGEIDPKRSNEDIEADIQRQIVTANPLALPSTLAVPLAA